MLSLLLSTFVTFLHPMPSHAIHGYHSEKCHIEDKTTQPFRIRSNYDWIEISAGEDEEESVEGSIIEKADALPTTGELILRRINVKDETSEKYDDGCWQGTQGSYRADLQVLKVSAKAEKLGVRANQIIPVVCSMEDIDPVGDSCEK